MKKDCPSIRKSLQKYLSGHLFKHQQRRISRHLNNCPVCRSEYEALKGMADTRQLLQDITPPSGLFGRFSAKVGTLSRLRLLLYRPLWLILIIAAVAAVYLSVFAPHRDIEIENLEKSIPGAADTAAPDDPAASAPVLPATAHPEPADKESTAPSREPLAITITAEEQAVPLINDLLQGHAPFRKSILNGSVREVAATLPAQELRLVLEELKRAGTLSYNRKQFTAIAPAQPVSVILRIKTPVKTVEHKEISALSSTVPDTAAAPASNPAVPGSSD